MRRTRRIGLIVMTGLAALLVILFFRFFDLVEREETFGYKAVTKENDLLAARRFLKAMGIAAENIPTPTPALPLPDHDAVILINSKRLAVNERTQEFLFDWVRHGGHLIFSLRSETIYDDVGDILKRLNEIEAGEDTMLQALEVESGILELSNEQRRELDQFGVVFPEAEDFLWVAFDPRLRIVNHSDRFRSLSGDGDGDTVITGRYGNGHITIFSDRNVLHNRRIGDRDHAAFLWYLVNLHGLPSKVWLVAHDNMPGIIIWLWGHARELIISLLLLLLMGFLTLMRRFGPIIGVIPPIRRRLLEHIQASGWFLWRFGHADKLLFGMQHNLRYELSIRHPGLQVLSVDEMSGKLSDIIEMSQDDIRQALGKKTIQSREDFTRTIRLCERLRKQL